MIEKTNADNVNEESNDDKDANKADKSPSNEEDGNVFES